MPDFASTIHAITGQELDHEILDLKSFSESVSEEQQMMAYIGLSRVKRADGLLLADPFSPCLFQQGKVIGPTVLMHYLRGKIPEKALKETLEDLAESRQERKPTLHNMKWACGRCGEAKTYDHYTALDTEDRHFLSKYQELILQRGAWRVCLSCSKGRSEVIFCAICQHDRPRSQFEEKEQ